jgi:hypothetical protein
VFHRFKVHLQVIDNGGSTTFILFDRVVSQVLGNTVQDLLDAMGNVCLVFSTFVNFLH